MQLRCTHTFSQTKSGSGQWSAQIVTLTTKPQSFHHCLLSILEFILASSICQNIICFTQTQLMQITSWLKKFPQILLPQKF